MLEHQELKKLWCSLDAMLQILSFNLKQYISKSQVFEENLQIIRKIIFTQMLREPETIILRCIIFPYQSKKGD